MMKKIVLGLVLLCSLQIYGQQEKDPNFTQKVFYSGFTVDEKGIWPQINNGSYFFLIKDSNYIVESIKSDKGGFMLPKDGPLLDTFKVEADIVSDHKKEDNGLVGIAIDVQNDMSGYIIEINNKKQFRVVQRDGQGNFAPVSNSGKGEGWLAYKFSPDVGYIHLSVAQAGRKVSVIIENLAVSTFENTVGRRGQCGLFISGLYKSKIKDFAVYAASNSGSTALKTDQTDTKATGDINTLNSALLDCRNSKKQLSDNIDMLNQEIALARKKNAELQTYISQNLDMKLQEDLKKQKEKADKLQGENNKLQNEMGDLRELKKTVAQNKDGDLVMVLSGNLKKEQQKNAALEKKIKELTTMKKPVKKK
jgi:hypothetical protein